MSYKEKVIRSSQAASSTLFITRCTSIMLHVIYLISRLRRFKIFTIFSYGSHFVSVVIFITGPWIISAEQHMQISFFSDWSKGRKCMGIFRFFWGGGREDFMFIFVFRKFFAWLIFHRFQNIWLQWRNYRQFCKFALNLGNSACKAYWFLCLYWSFFIT